MKGDSARRGYACLGSEREIRGVNEGLDERGSMAHLMHAALAETRKQKFIVAVALWFFV